MIEDHKDMMVARIDNLAEVVAEAEAIFRIAQGDFMLSWDLEPEINSSRAVMVLFN